MPGGDGFIRAVTSPKEGNIRSIFQENGTLKVTGPDGEVIPIAGIKGDTGDTGPAGPQGPAGEKGEKGEDAVIGAKSITGDKIADNTIDYENLSENLKKMFNGSHKIIEEGDFNDCIEPGFYTMRSASAHCPRSNNGNFFSLIVSHTDCDEDDEEGNYLYITQLAISEGDIDGDGSYLCLPIVSYRYIWADSNGTVTGYGKWIELATADDLASVSKFKQLTDTNLDNATTSGTYYSIGVDDVYYTSPTTDAVLLQSINADGFVLIVHTNDHGIVEHEIISNGLRYTRFKTSSWSTWEKILTDASAGTKLPTGTEGYELVSDNNGQPVWRKPAYYTCSTAGSNQEKTTGSTDPSYNFRKVAGVKVSVKFTNAHTSPNSATLNINGTGASAIVRHNGGSYRYVNSITESWKAGEIVEFQYIGNYWVAVSSDQGFVQASAIDMKNQLADKMNAPTELASNVNLDDVITEGVYWLGSSNACTSSTIDGSILNNLHADGFTLIVCQDGTTQQEFITLGWHYYRYHTSGWSDLSQVCLDNHAIGFSTASSRTNISTGDSIKTMFGKIAKWFADLANGAASSLLGANLTANRALLSSNSGKVAVSSITSTELGHLSGVKSNIQNQLDSISNTVAHTSNLDNSGVVIDDSGYKDNENWTRVLSIPGAKGLKVTAIYESESPSFDWGCIWEGNHLDYTATANYTVSTSGKLATDYKTTKTFYIAGDTITVAWRSDGSNHDYYGLYVSIEDASSCTWSPEEVSSVGITKLLALKKIRLTAGEYAFYEQHLNPMNDIIIEGIGPDTILTLDEYTKCSNNVNITYSDMTVIKGIDGSAGGESGSITFRNCEVFDYFARYGSIGTVTSLFNGKYDSSDITFINSNLHCATYTVNEHCTSIIKNARNVTFIGGTITINSGNTYTAGYDFNLIYYCQKYKFIGTTIVTNGVNNINIVNEGTGEFNGGSIDLNHYRHSISHYSTYYKWISSRLVGVSISYRGTYLNFGTVTGCEFYHMCPSDSVNNRITLLCPTNMTGNTFTGGYNDYINANNMKHIIQYNISHNDGITIQSPSGGLISSSYNIKIE